MKWISVKEGLPNEAQKVLFYHDGDYYVGVVQIIYSDGYVVFKELSGAFMYNIPATHWMPLPEPPKP